MDRVRVQPLERALKPAPRTGTVLPVSRTLTLLRFFLSSHSKADLPVAALRASMEALSKELSRGDRGRGMIVGALEEVDRIGRNVQDLMEFAQAPEPLPL